jgi:hypothetical protein
MEEKLVYCCTCLENLWWFMRLEPLISHTGILMTFYLSIILDLQNFFYWYILQSWKLKRPLIQLRPHHFWTYTSNLTTVVNSVLKFMITGTTRKKSIFNIQCYRKSVQYCIL